MSTIASESGTEYKEEPGCGFCARLVPQDKCRHQTMQKTRFLTTEDIMSGHAIIGKKALLEWINNDFQMGYTQLEQCGSGAFYCQVVDSMFPGSIPLHRVNFAAKAEHEYLPNYKLLQSAFTSNRVSKHIDVPQLVKCRMQDNLEFLQWLKSFHDAHAPSGYDAAQKRIDARAKLPPSAAVTSPASAPPAASHSSAALGTRTRPAPFSPHSAPSRGKHPALARAEAQLAAASTRLQAREDIRNRCYERLRGVESLCQEDEAAVGVPLSVVAAEATREGWRGGLEQGQGGTYAGDRHKNALLGVLYDSDGGEDGDGAQQQPEEREQEQEQLTQHQHQEHDGFEQVQQEQEYPYGAGETSAGAEQEEEHYELPQLPQEEEMLVPASGPGPELGLGPEVGSHATFDEGWGDEEGEDSNLMLPEPTALVDDLEDDA